LESGEIKMIDLIANGEDNLNPLNQQFIMTKIKYDEASDLYLGHVEFHIKYYDEFGQKYYSMKGKLKDGIAVRIEYFDPNYGIYWANALWVSGEGLIKESSTNKYVPAIVGMLASTGGWWYYWQWNPILQIWFQVWGYSDVGPWAWAGVLVDPGLDIWWGTTTVITKYMETIVP
ncbi:MAG: hypothetical protein ACW980_23790, partial [Promethearchaeota archaeon]